MIGKLTVLLVLFLVHLDVCKSYNWYGSKSIEFEVDLPTEPPNDLPHDIDTNVKRAAGWLLSRRLVQNAWGEDTPRAFIALVSADPRLIQKDILMMRQQLSVDVALDLLRNDSQNQIPLYRLAQHIRSLIATCQDPERFFERNLVQELRFKTSSILETGQAVLPSLILTLCLANKITDGDAKSLSMTYQSLVHSGRHNGRRYDVEAYSSIASACIMERSKRHSIYHPNFFNALNSTVRDYINNVKQGDVYTVALLLQALNAWSFAPESHQLNEQRDQIKTFLLALQMTDGSFGDILSTYYALPAIAGRSLLDLHASCSNRTVPYKYGFTIDGKPINIEIILWVMRNGKIEANCVHFAIGESWTLFEAMLWAASKNPVFKFKHDVTKNGIFIFEIDETPNDGEKMLYWRLYVNPPKTNSNMDINTASKMQSSNDGLNFIHPKEGDKFLFWYKSI